MSTPSIRASSCAADTPSLLNARIKSLEVEHKQLEERLRERVESLAMQINLAQRFVPFAQLGLSSTLDETLTQQHADLHQRCSLRLINAQVQIQQEAEIKEIIKNYEKRIMDLRSMLVGKEAEIVYDTYEIRRDNIPKRENLQIFNNQLAEKVAVRKSLEELKKIRVEVGALDHAVKMKTAAALCSKKGLPPAEVSFLSCTNTEEERGSERVDALSLKKKASSSQRDKLMVKVNQLLMDELAKEDTLKESLRQHKLQWQSTTTEHQQLCAKYKALMTERTKANQIITTDNLLIELENEEQQCVDAAKMADLFGVKDPNVNTTDVGKHAKRRNNLKEKRKQRSKEN